MQQLEFMINQFEEPDVVARLSALSNLRVLDIRRVGGVTSHALGGLCCPNLQVLSLPHDDVEFWPDGITALVRNTPALQEANFEFLKIGDSGLK